MEFMIAEKMLFQIIINEVFETVLVSWNDE